MLNPAGPGLVVMDAGFTPLSLSRIGLRAGSHHKVHLGGLRTEARCGCTVIPRSRDRPLRRALRERVAEAPRGAVPAPHPQGARLVWQRIGADPSAVPAPGSIPTGIRRPVIAARQWPPRPLGPSIPGHCLRSGVHDWDPRRALTAPGSALSSPSACAPSSTKSNRSDGHLFITVIAYQLVQTIRRRLAEHGENASWTTLRRILEGQQRVTASFRRKDGRTLHVRKATRAEQRQLKIYSALDLHPAPGACHQIDRLYLKAVLTPRLC